MAMSTSCCLNLPPPNPSSKSSSLPKISQVSCWKNDGSTKSQCISGMACVIFVLEVGNSTSLDSSAIVKDMQLVLQPNEKVTRWSEKRMCPPWRANSLETIVPENLPRPSARRRWEAVAFPRAAPEIKVTDNTNPRCFTL